MLTPIWGFVAVIGSVIPLQSRPAASQPEVARYVVPADRPWWVREGLVIASVRESLSDRAWRTTNGRTRTPTYNEREAQKLERGEETLTRLKALGVNLVLVPYGGYAPDSAETEERRITRETIARCHTLGLKCGVWIPVGQIDAAVWKADGKDVSDWLVLTQSGTPLAAPIAGRSFTSDAASEVRARARRLVEEISKLDVDAVFVPDWRVPVGFEAAARNGFGEFLKRGTAPARAALGLLEKSGIPTDGESPLMNPWVAYRTGLLSEALHEIVEGVRRGRAAMFVGVDCGNPARQIGIPAGPAVDPPELLRGIDAVLSTARPELSERGEIRNQIPDLKMAVASGARCVPRVDSKLALVQQLAFGGDCGGILAHFDASNFAGDDVARIGIEKLAIEATRQYRERRELYADMRPVADLLVWQPREARLWCSTAAEVEQLRAVSALVTHRIPFSFLFGELPDDLDRDAAILVAGMPAVPENRASDLRRFVSRGGGVVVVGAASVVDSDGKTVNRDLAQYVTETSSSPAAASQVKGQPGVLMRKFDQGRVVSIAQPGAPLNLRIMRRSTSKSKNAPALGDDDLSIAVRAGLGRGLSVESELERGSALELARSDDGRRTVLHVVNFNPDGALAGETLHVRVKDAGSVAGVWRYSIDRSGYEAAEFRRGEGAIAIELKPVALYDAYLIEQK